MGGCVSTLLNYRNSASEVPHPFLKGEAPNLTSVVPGTETATTSAIYRYIGLGDEEEYQRVLKEHKAAKNWVQMIEERCKDQSTRIAMAYRLVEKVEKRPVKDASGKERLFDYFHLSKRQQLTFGEMWQNIVDFGSGLKTLGIPEGSAVTIYEETRWEWIISIYGIWTQNMLATTVYANLGEDALAYALEETQSAAIITSGKNLKGLLALLRAQPQQEKPIVVYLDSIPGGIDTSDFHVVSWTEVKKRGAAAKHPAKVPTDNDKEALIMYTSGTTGNPKGVLHTHGSIAAGIRALSHRLEDIYDTRDPDEVYCAFLPLAHILEFGIVNIIMNRGSLVAFCNPRTLVDTYALPHGDFKEFRPRVIIGVPRIFDTIKKAAEAQLPPPGSFKRAIFDRAYQSRLAALNEGRDTPFWNEKVFSAARAYLGGNVYSMLSGGGPLSAETQEFVAVCFGGPIVIQGWGLTETVCVGATQRLDYIEPGDVGNPLVTCEMRLLDVEEYTHTDKPEPRGEILLRGPFLFKGYYKQEKLTQEALDKDGWFHTGDVGSIGPKGSLRIVGRVKALAKNVLGEYIAMEALESMYSQNELCATNGVCVLVHPSRPYITALVLTEGSRALAFAKKHRIDGTFKELLQNDVFQAKAAESLTQTAKAAGRKSFEFVKFVCVLDDEWTPENGLMTPTAKLRRSQIEQHYAEDIAKLFAKDA